MDRVDERALLRELGARRDNFEFAQKEALRAARELSILQRIHGWWGSGMVEKIAEVNGMRRMLFFAEPSWPMSPEAMAVQNEMNFHIRCAQELLEEDNVRRGRPAAGW